MDIDGLERRLKEENLLTIYDEEIQKKYINGKYVFKKGTFRNHINVFGIYKDGMRYCCFITDSEKGFQLSGRYCISEEQACESLYEEIVKMNKNHKVKIEKELKQYIEDNNMFNKFINHIDIATEFVKYKKLNEWPWPKIKIFAYTAKYLNEEYNLEIIDAYNYMIDLRENPEETLKKLRKITKKSIKRKK